MEQVTAKQKRLRKRDTALLIGTALLFDLLSLIPGENVLVSIFGQSVIPFIFSRYGINVFSFKNSVPYVVGFIVEVIPGASILPAFTLETLIIIYMSK
jgi:hypothetical protein